MIGSTIRHYTIESRLGEGGMGTVYRARDTRLNAATYKEKGRISVVLMRPREIIPAVTYSPTQLPMQYHRR